ncbi:MAG TPA: hypothetical protein DCM87_19005 [Planctomycetes bacterium]|nr:hypothetical protein [Planctomycetota bacterium]
MLALAAVAARGAVLENDLLRAEFDGRGLVALRDKAANESVRFERDGFAIAAEDGTIDAEFADPAGPPETSATAATYRYQAGPWRARVVYALEPGRRFLTKQIFLEGGSEHERRVYRVEMLRCRIETPVLEELRIRSGALLRFGGAGGTTHGVFAVVQNPFLQYARKGQDFSFAYAPDTAFRPRDGAFASDLLCIGTYALSGPSYPAAMVPEWKLVPAAQASQGARIHACEVDALVECVRAFLLWKPARSIRMHVGWCGNDYQIDIGTPEGRTEYRRIIDQAAAAGCTHILFGPANREVSSLDECRDAWGWENLLWLTMGQKLRKGEWDPAKDALPASVQELVDYARARGVRMVAYVYPSLPFMQDPEWTRWVPNGRPGGYLGADTGQRSFQDWLLDKLAAFHERAGGGGFAFDHWWIAYEDTVSSKYAQWAGTRRILEELRRRLPDAMIDGRQQYHGFGVWTWLAGSYPHPLYSDEQPESFRAFPDLHWSRVSADRQRRTAWYYRMEHFTPPEIMPGYMTHQTPRNDAQGRTVRTSFRAADWDLLGWKYSVISSIATAPFNHVVNLLPARDEREFAAFKEAGWFRAWLDWTDANAELLRNVRPILGAPQLGCADGTAAFLGARGVIFLFNPNYWTVTARVPLDETIGLDDGSRFVLRQLYPDAEKGRLLAPEGKAFFGRGDTLALDLPPTEALVLEVEPAPAPLAAPLLLGATGKAELEDGVLRLTGVRGEPGTTRALAAALPVDARVRAASVNGVDAKFRQEPGLVSLRARFAGTAFGARQRIGSPDPSFAGGVYKAEATIPARVFAQLAARARAWPVAYSAEERAAAWLNSDRLILFISVADPDDEKLTGVALAVDSRPVEVKPAYTAIVRSNPRNTFVGWYADISSLAPDVPHVFEATLPALDPGRFLGLFLDTVEADYTDLVADTKG